MSIKLIECCFIMFSGKSTSLMDAVCNMYEILTRQKLVIEEICVCVGDKKLREKFK